MPEWLVTYACVALAVLITLFLLGAALMICAVIYAALKDWLIKRSVENAYRKSNTDLR